MLRAAQLPYERVLNSTQAELHGGGLTFLRIMVYLEPYGFGDAESDPSDSNVSFVLAPSSTDGGGGPHDPGDLSHDPPRKDKKKKN